MNYVTTLLTISFWIGAILDAKAGLILIFPKLLPPLYAMITGESGEKTADGAAFRQLVGLFSLSWTCLFIWALQMPLERKGIALIVILPLSGLIAIRVANKRAVRKIFSIYNLFTWLLILLTALFAVSYLVSIFG